MNSSVFRFRLTAVLLIFWPVLNGPVLRAACQEPHDSVGTSHWFGSMDAESRHFRFYVTIAGSEEGLQGTLMSLDEGSSEFKLEGVQFDSGTLHFKLPSTGAQYVGNRVAGEDRVEGLWKQAGSEFKLDFQRVQEVPEQSLKVYWTGQLDAIFQKLDVAFREVDDSTVLFDSISQRVGGFVAKKSVAGTTVTFEVPMVGGKFTGEMNADGTIITGKWKQGAAALDLILRKSEQARKEIPTAPKRPQNPVEPFPYAIEEFKVENPTAVGVTLAGTLTIPESDRPVPAVILISGSGPQDRDETIVDHKPFWVIADHLSRNGIAVLRFDDRGVGQSTGDFSVATSLDFAEDVKALVRFLRSHAKIDPRSIALCGHSEGGLIAPMVAADDSMIAAIVLLAAPGVPGQKVLISQARLILEAAGTPEEEVSRQMKLQRELINLAIQEPTLERDAYFERVQTVIKETLGSEDFSEEDVKAIAAQSSEQLLSPWFQFFLKYDPANAFRQVRCPTLILNGGLDLQVDPNLNVPAIEAAFAAGGLQDYEVNILGGLNHLFQAAKTGGVSEYAEIEETFNQQALDIMSEWLRRKLMEQ